jgi:hypothetical protein
MKKIIDNRRKVRKDLRNATGNNPVFKTFHDYDYIKEVNFEGIMTLCYVSWFYDDEYDEDAVEYCRVIDDPRFQFNWTATVENNIVKRNLGYRWIASGFRREVLKG